MIIHLSACGLGSPAEVEDWFTLDRLSTAIDYVRDHPPAHLLLAGRYGYKAPEEEEEMTAQDFRAMGITVG